MFIIVGFVSFFLSLTRTQSVFLFYDFLFFSYEHKKFFYCTVGAQAFRCVATAKMVESGWKANYLLICEVAFQILVVVYCICSFVSVASDRHTANSY